MKGASTDAVASVLDRIERHERNANLAIFAAMGVEGLLIAAAIVLVDWKNRTQILVFVFSVLGYTIVSLGLLALGAHVSRVGARVVKALDERRSQS